MEEPVIICEYSSEWINLFEKEKKSILNTVGEYTKTIEHIGSTAIEGLAAKPIIDILVGLNSFEDAKDCIPKLEELNYEYVQEVELTLHTDDFLENHQKVQLKENIIFIWLKLIAIFGLDSCFLETIYVATLKFSKSMKQ
ncbi:MAG: GrpB family protein [Candidatus Heimdallarchaeota archaeon]